MTKQRLDTLVQRQAGVTRSQAQGLIHTGKVFAADGRQLDKPGLNLPEDTVLRIEPGQRYASRGGEKLEAALVSFNLDVSGIVAIDVGASTGGFSDCLLQHGAARVYAVDVGYGQLAWKLRQDPRVIVFERTNIRHLSPDGLPEKPAFFTVDCSFISLRIVLQSLRALLQPDARGVALIKPQFEAGKELVGKGGVVRDEHVHESVIAGVLTAAQALGYESGGVIPSPLLGPAGNREFLALLHYKGPHA